MKQVLDFLTELENNNNREWFNDHKEQYKIVNQICKDFAEKLIESIAQFDTSIRGVTVADSTYRIYRDTRFSPDKTPYKNHIGIYICRGGKKSGYAGYYIHLQGNDKCILASGLHCLEPKIIKSVREDIDLNGSRFTEALRQASGFEIDTQTQLKRMPKGYIESHPNAQYLKLKDFILIAPLPISIVLSDKLIEHACSAFAKCKNFNDIMNQCVDYAREI